MSTLRQLEQDVCHGSQTYTSCGIDWDHNNLAVGVANLDQAGNFTKYGPNVVVSQLSPPSPAIATARAS
jgi:hypothetical protein